MEKIIGIDLGTNSIGWAVRDTAEIENQIIDKGVLTFEKGVGEEKGIEVPKVKARTEARGKRRNYQAEKYRKYALLECLIENNMCPLTIDELNEWRHYKKGIGRKYPQRKEFIDWLRFDFDGNGKPDFERFGLSKHESYYVFRAMIVDETKKEIFKNEPYIIGRVLYQMVQRRGYNNMFNLIDSDKDLTNLLDEDKNKIEPYINKYKTLGAALYHIQKETNCRIRKRYNLRSDFNFELEQICKIHNLENLLPAFRRAIIEQRPLRSQKGSIGFCTLERPLKSASGKFYKAGKKRVPLSHPVYEEFRTWVDINNLKIEAPKGFNQTEFLTTEIFSIFNRSSDLKYTNYKKDKNEPEKKDKEKGLKERIEDKGGTIHSQFDIDLNEENEGKKYKGNIFLNRLEKIFGDNWKEILKWDETINGISKTGNYLRAEDIWHLVFDATITKQQTKELGNRLLPILEKYFPNIEFEAKDFDGIRLQQGYASLSLATIKKILPYLKQGMLYPHAVFVANLENVFGVKLEPETIEKLKTEYTQILYEHKRNKEIYGIVNSLISDRMNERDRINMGGDYILDKHDMQDIELKIKDNFKTKVWNKKTEKEQLNFIDEVKKLYQEYLRQPLGVDKGKQFYKVYRIEEKIIELLRNKYNISDDRIKKYLWHPSEQEVYSPANIKADKDGVVFTDESGNDILFLGDPNPISRGFKNPMAIKSLQYLKKLLNYLLQVKKIDANTKVVLEIARELNDANNRAAIKRYQSDRETLRAKYKKEIEEYFHKQGNTNKNITPEFIDRYELWKEQNQKCMYCLENISCADVMNGTAQIEHTIPEGLSNCSELFNLTIAHPHCNNIKAKRIPFEWTDNYELIKNNVKFMYATYMDYKKKVEETYTKAKTATTKESKDKQIQLRHYYKQYLSYWKKKYETFVMEDVTSKFRRQQLTDTQIITKYALPYLKTVFKKVEVQKGIITAEFRKIYQIQPQLQRKERTKHSHHAIDAAVLTLIPPASIRDFIRKEYYDAKEKNIPYYNKPKNWNDFKSEYIHNIEHEVLINFQAQHRTLTPTIKKVRKRGEIQSFKDEQGNKQIRKAQGDTIRGQLHKESFFGAIKKNNELLLVERYPVATFTSINDCKNIVDNAVRKIVQEELENRMKKGLSFDKAKIDPIPFPNGKAVIKKVRCKVAAGRGYLTPEKALPIHKHTYQSKHDYKHTTYAQNEENTLCLYYETETEKGIERAFKIVGLFELAQLNLNSFTDIIQDAAYNKVEIGRGNNKKELPLSFILKTGTQVIFFKEHLEELKELASNELLKRMFKIYKFNEPAPSTVYIYLQNHIESRKNDELGNGENNLDFTKYQSRVFIASSKFTAAIQGKHFEINPDGQINWKF